MLIQRGIGGKLHNHVNDGRAFGIATRITGNAGDDFCSVGVDSAGKLSDDCYMVF